MNEYYYILTYTVYLVISLTLVFFVSRMLFKNALVFMVDIFRGNQELAKSTNKLFEIGFYLLNVGFALLIMRIITRHLDSYQDVFEVLSAKIGGFAIYLGIMLFLNLMMFFKGRSKTKRSMARERAFATQGATTQEPGQDDSNKYLR